MSPDVNSNILLGRIRFLNKCIECFRKSEHLPESLCYVPKEVCYKICKDSSSGSVSASSSTAGNSGGKSVVSVRESPHQAPHKKSCKCNIEPKKSTCIRTTGEEYCNGHGLWVKISKEQLEEYCAGLDIEEGWILVCKHTEGGDRLVPVESPETISRQQQLFGYDHKPCSRWEQVVDVENSLHMGAKPRVAEPDEAAVQKLRYVPPTWMFECDEDLVHYFYDHIGKEDENLGSVKQCVTSIDVSSSSEDPSGGASCLTDGDTETFWESDGMQGQHWIRLHMKRGTVVNKLILTVDSTDDNYMPKRVTVYGGEGDNLKKYSDVTIDDNLIGEVCVLEDMTSHLPVIEIRIEECRDEGIDVRIRGLKIKSSCERDLGLNADVFQSPNLVRYPRLEGTPPDVLYRRALVIQRFITLLDSLLPHMVPAWDYSLGTFNQIKCIKQFLLLSKRRSALITQCLKDSETSKPNFMPRLYINRRLAMEHRDNPTLDSTCKNAVFTQVYEGLKPSDKYEKTLDYRWPARYDQWWECKFIAEGIIDQGGGFRDSLADMSEELCPSSSECPVPLPFFTRTSNQGAGEARDFYVPNPSCREFHKFEWIGQLMGAALRGKDFLVLALPGLVWKQLIGETVSWTKDFPAVDSVLVKLLEAMEHMDMDTFDFKFGQELVYTTPLSDGRLVELIPGGSGVVVRYEDRMEFIRLVQKSRLEESREQVAAMQAGLVKVVPQAVLDLLTWQEVEKKVCGDPEITVEALKRLTRYEDLEQTDVRVQYLWEALMNFTNEDRSRFLRFVTGRSRLPAPIYIFPDKQGSETTDALPQSSTCSSTLYLPKYPSAKVCEEKLRYAAYNCVAIDTDMSPWEE
ncbi:E3 ubiquitin-protein ligase HECTD3 [Pimephales promelas]|uniref:E3 ubiquitin-protein ligase HECTD3 n=1 Tax=Pimephales promelas TaxID=90988 RepID=UPI0019557720|nr:E3 ubiquitin-protein ligase HECTD3 [Pimephales promelas]KAG1969952.1 E3 ubiquitin-protein ligase HECTD3 [Pimephales promelas]